MSMNNQIDVSREYDPDQQTPSADRSRGPNLSLLLNRMTVVGVATSGLFGIAVLFALDVASAFFIPVLLAHLLDRLLSPLVRTGERFGLPTPMGAGIVLLAFFGILGIGAYYLSEPATEWIESAPQKIQIAEYKLRGLTEPLEKVQKAAEKVDEATEANQGGEQTVTVQQEGSAGAMLMSQTRAFTSGLLITIFLLYFLLASGDLLLKKIVHMLPRFRHRKNAVQIIRSIERDLSQYLGMICLINLGLGIAVAGAMYGIGMPNPLLWGALAGMLNFIPYLGPVVNIAVVGLVAFVSFDHVSHAIMAPLAYLILNGIEASLVTPTVMGWRLQLNPVVIFIALTFWTWVWGIPGALLAVPILASVKITCDRIEILKPIGVLLGK
jgi:predicted PurR-regulated permease PerM